jgi:hypothetical protein
MRHNRLFKCSIWLTGAILATTLLAWIFSSSLIAPIPATWNAAHVGMQRVALQNAVGMPTGGDYEEERMERWASDSPLVYRTMLVWYSDATRPTTATEVTVLSHWHFGIEIRERDEGSNK